MIVVKKIYNHNIIYDEVPNSWEYIKKNIPYIDNYTNNI